MCIYSPSKSEKFLAVNIKGMSFKSSGAVTECWKGTTHLLLSESISFHENSHLAGNLRYWVASDLWEYCDYTCRKVLSNLSSFVPSASSTSRPTFVVGGMPSNRTSKKRPQLWRTSVLSASNSSEKTTKDACLLKMLRGRQIPAIRPPGSFIRHT